MRKAVISVLILALTFLVIAAVLIGTGHAETSRPRPNSLGVSEVYQNQFSYIIALPIDGQIIDGKFTNVRLWPVGTPELYDTTLLFCGDVTDKFEGKKGVLALTYETRAHAMHKSIGCHELLMVNEVK